MKVKCRACKRYVKQKKLQLHMAPLTMHYSYRCPRCEASGEPKPTIGEALEAWISGPLETTEQREMRYWREHPTVLLGDYVSPMAPVRDLGLAAWGEVFKAFGEQIADLQNPFDREIRGVKRIEIVIKATTIGYKIEVESPYYEGGRPDE